MDASSKLSPEHWRKFFIIAVATLGAGTRRQSTSSSWCGWTTFTLLREGVHYLEGGLPPTEEILELGLEDGGLWGQPFRFDDLAHVVLPRTYFWERHDGGQYENGFKSQDLDALSKELRSESIPHRLSDMVLEIKLY